MYLFIRSLKLSLRILRHTSFEEFESTTCIPIPLKIHRSRRYAQSKMDKSRSLPKVPDRTKRFFKFRLESPRNWSGILRVDEAAGNTLWKDGAEKEVAFLTAILLLPVI